MTSSPKKIIISVISDLVTDQRVNRAASSLAKRGFDVILIGRQMRKSLPIEPRSYKIVRFRLPFETGPLFYAVYNIRLFFYLISHKADLLISNDLDTLTANYLAARFKRCKLVYDSHEYFTEVPELVSRPLVRSIWKRIESRIVPKLNFMMTVNESIASFYTSKYRIPVHVIRNLPVIDEMTEGVEERKKWNLPSDKKIFLFQGAGINIDRGAEEAIEAIRKVENAVLLFVGAGDVIEKIQKQNQAESKIFFIPKQPMKELIRFTRMADFGLTLDKDTNLNYKYSLPNKLFDYIRAGLPVIATDLPEVSRIVKSYDVGIVIPSAEPSILSSAMIKMMGDQNKIDSWKKNANIAAMELCWEKEEKKFLEIINDALAT